MYSMEKQRQFTLPIETIITLTGNEVKQLMGEIKNE